MLELTNTDVQRIVTRHTIVGIELENTFRQGEVVHKQERPAVGNPCFSPEDGPLEIERTGGLSTLVVVFITAMHVAIDGDSFFQFLHPVNALRFLFVLCKGCTTDESHQQSHTRRLEKIFLSHIISLKC